MTLILTPATEGTKTLTATTESSLSLSELNEPPTQGLIPPFIPGPSAIPSRGGPVLTELEERQA